MSEHLHIYIENDIPYGMFNSSGPRSRPYSITLTLTKHKP